MWIPYFPGKPLLIVHGWPGSVWEFYKIIPMLTDPAASGGRDEDAFEVIAPSIPGYGFSEAPHRTGDYLYYLYNTNSNIYQITRESFMFYCLVYQPVATMHTHNNNGQVNTVVYVNSLAHDCTYINYYSAICSEDYKNSL